MESFEQAGEHEAGTEEQTSEGGGLRKQYEQALSENKTLKAQLRKQGFQIAGIDPSQGVGKLLFSAYDGEADVEKIREFAQEYGIDPKQGSESAETAAPPPELSDEERERQAAQQRLTDLQSGSQSGAQTPSIGDQIAAAEKKGLESGDWEEFDRLQVVASLQPK